MASYNLVNMPDSPPSRPPLLRTDSPPSAPEPDSPSSAYRHGSRGAHAQGPEGDRVLVCVAVWTYAIIYFAALYSYRLEALRLRRVIRGA